MKSFMRYFKLSEQQLKDPTIIHSLSRSQIIVQQNLIKGKGGE